MNSLANGPAGGEQASQESTSGAEVYARPVLKPAEFWLGEVWRSSQAEP